MNATNFFTRRILGMDYRVWVTMLLVCFLSLGLYSFKQIRFNHIKSSPCSNDSITVNSKKVESLASCLLNQLTFFGVQSDSAVTVEWDFGDDSNLEKGQLVSHKFIEEKTYRVTAIVNGECKIKIDIEVVQDPLLLVNQEKPLVTIIPDPMSPTIGSTVNFYCVSDISLITSYEWKVVEKNEVRVDSVPAFTFNDGGVFTIQLILNNDPSTRKTWQINVSTKSPQEQGTSNSGPIMGMPTDIGQLEMVARPGFANTDKNLPSDGGSANNNQGTIKPDTSSAASLPKAPLVDSNAFKELLQNVVDQDGKELEDLYKYLDYKSSTMVEVNENKSKIPLKDFCKIMREKKKKKRKIASVSFQMDDRKSIQAIRVKIAQGGGFLDWLNPFN